MAKTITILRQIDSATVETDQVQKEYLKSKLMKVSNQMDKLQMTAYKNIGFYYLTQGVIVAGVITGKRIVCENGILVSWLSMLHTVIVCLILGSKAVSYCHATASKYRVETKYYVVKEKIETETKRKNKKKHPLLWRNVHFAFLAVIVLGYVASCAVFVASLWILTCPGH